MMTQAIDKQIKFHMVTIESLVPEGHLLRKLDRLVDFSFIYREVEDCYCHNNGRPSIDPVVLVKYLLLGFLYGIESERRIEQVVHLCIRQGLVEGKLILTDSIHVKANTSRKSEQVVEGDYSSTLSRSSFYVI